MIQREILSKDWCRWVIAMEYYDGSLSGMALKVSDASTFFFQAVAWDAEHWTRVFAVTTIKDDLGVALREALIKHEPPSEPYWLPGPATNTVAVSEAWQNLKVDALSRLEWRLIECHDLLEVATTTTLTPSEGKQICHMVREGTVLELHSTPLMDSLEQRMRVTP